MLNVSLLSSVIPNSLTSLLSSIVSPQTSMGRRDHFLFHVNMTIFVLSALMLSPLDWHQFSIVFIVTYLVYVWSENKNVNFIRSACPEFATIP